MARPMTEKGFNARTAKMLKAYAKHPAWVWLETLSREEATDKCVGGGLVCSIEDAEHYAFFNSMPESYGYTTPTYNQETLGMFEGSVDAYHQDLLSAYSSR